MALGGFRSALGDVVQADRRLRVMRRVGSIRIWCGSTHRFHPLSGRSFEFVKRCKTWQSDRVFFFDDSGELAHLPAEWTDVVPADPFVVVSAGRSPFRTADLLVLAELVAQLGAGSGAARRSVKKILP